MTYTGTFLNIFGGAVFPALRSFPDPHDHVTPQRVFICPSERYSCGQHPFGLPDPLDPLHPLDFSLHDILSPSRDIRKTAYDRRRPADGLFHRRSSVFPNLPELQHQRPPIQFPGGPPRIHRPFIHPLQKPKLNSLSLRTPLNT